MNFCYLKEQNIEEIEFAVLSNPDCVGCPYFGVCSSVKLGGLKITETGNDEVVGVLEREVFNKEGFQTQFEEDDIQKDKGAYLDNHEDDNEELWEDGEKESKIDYLEYDEEDVIGLSELDGEDDEEEDVLPPIEEVDKLPKKRERKKVDEEESKNKEQLQLDLKVEEKPKKEKVKADKPAKSNKKKNLKEIASSIEF